MTSLRHPTGRSNDAYTAEHYEANRDAVLSSVRRRLRAAGVFVSEPDIEAAYSSSFLELLKHRDEPDHYDDGVRGWLTKGTYWRCLDEAKKARGRIELVDREDHGREDLVGRVAMLDAVRATVEVIRHRFSDRDAKIVALVLTEHKRAEIAEILDLPIKRVGKLLDGHKGRPGLMARLGEYLEVIARGEWCEYNASLIRAHALGLLAEGSPKVDQAEAHLRDCPACRNYSREYRRQLHELLPPFWAAVAASDRTGVVEQLHGAVRGAVDWARSLVAGGDGAAVAGGGAGVGGGTLAIGSLSAGKVVATCVATAGVGCAALLGGGIVRLPDRGGPDRSAATEAASTQSEPSSATAGGRSAGLTLTPSSLQAALSPRRAGDDDEERPGLGVNEGGLLVPNREFDIEASGSSSSQRREKPKRERRTYDMNIENPGPAGQSGSSGRSKPSGPATSTSPPPSSSGSGSSGGGSSSPPSSSAPAAEAPPAPTHETFGIER